MEVKENVINFIKNNKIKIFAVIGFAVIFMIVSVVIFNVNKKESQNNELVYNDIEKTSTNEEIISEYVYVDIKGMVKTPGIYMMNMNDRVNDVINKSGGLLNGANTRYINLSKKIVDEMVIVIYSQEEIDGKLNSLEKVNDIPCLCESTINDACIESSYTESNINEDNTSTSNLININKASLSELMTLTGIGETKAQAIIEYRKINGNFISKEDLMEVSGIGESTYSKIKDLITTE